MSSILKKFVVTFAIVLATILGSLGVSSVVTPAAAVECADWDNSCGTPTFETSCDTDPPPAPNTRHWKFC